MKPKSSLLIPIVHARNASLTQYNTIKRSSGLTNVGDTP
jgi:hypothetical protein